MMTQNIFQHHEKLEIINKQHAIIRDYLEKIKAYLNNNFVLDFSSIRHLSMVIQSHIYFEDKLIERLPITKYGKYISEHFDIHENVSDIIASLLAHEDTSDAETYLKINIEFLIKCIWGLKKGQPEDIFYWKSKTSSWSIAGSEVGCHEQ